MTVWYPSFHNHKEAVLWIAKQIRISEAKIMQESIRLSELRDLLAHNQRELAKKGGKI